PAVRLSDRFRDLVDRCVKQLLADPTSDLGAVYNRRFNQRSVPLATKGFCSMPWSATRHRSSCCG
ncbi:MAG: hypothetical protein ACRDS9_28115, partial [Pseudonocardiaceae bacterium]